MAEEKLEDDESVMSEATAWVFDNHSDGQNCCFCGFKATTDDGRGLKGHLRTHTEKVLAFYLNPELGQDALAYLRQAREAEVNSEKRQGLEVLEDYDTPNLLHVPDTIRSKVMGSGNYGRWVSPANVQRRLDAGYEIVPRPQGVSNLHGSDVDTKIKANEMVYMMTSGEKRRQWEARQQMKTDRQTGAVLGRQEDAAKHSSDVGRATYQNAIQQGIMHENAMMLANKADQQGHVIRIPSRNAQHHR